MGRVDGKVALITGAARGQGRSHAIRLAEEGADIIALDICAPIASAVHTFGTEEDLAETAAAVERLDRRIVTRKVDVRDRDGMAAAVDDGVGELGRLDIVCVNAGMVSISPVLELTPQAWHDVVDVVLTGGFHTAQAAIPHVLAGGRGGSVVFTSSVMGLAAAPGLGHYAAAKHGIIGLMKTLAMELGPQGVRVNAVCPTNVATDMILNPTALHVMMPDIEHPTRADAEQPGSGFRAAGVIPVPWVDPVDVSHAVLYLASDDARFVTGVAFPVDAGFLLK